MPCSERREPQTCATRALHHSSTQQRRTSCGTQGTPPSSSPPIAKAVHQSSAAQQAAPNQRRIAQQRPQRTAPLPRQLQGRRQHPEEGAGGPEHHAERRTGQPGALVAALRRGRQPGRGFPAATRCAECPAAAAAAASRPPATAPSAPCPDGPAAQPVVGAGGRQHCLEGVGVGAAQAVGVEPGRQLAGQGPSRVAA